MKIITRIKLKYLVLVFCIFLTLKLLGVFSHIFERNFYNDFHYPYDGDVQESVAQLRHGLIPDITPINQYNYTFLTNCEHKCRNGDEILKPRLVYIVKSAVAHFSRRNAIRKTWGYEHRFSDVIIRTVFILGRNDFRLQSQVEEESKQNRDIIQADFYDTYFNNTIKTMLAFKWATTYCPNSKYYMFVDDDMYVSTKNVLRFVRNPTNYPAYLKQPIYSHSMDFELPDDVRLYAGYVFISSPHRHIISKWHVTLDEYPYHMWPPYVTAGSYVVSREALHELYYTSFYTKYFRFDDIYLGLVALKANIEPYHCAEFHFYKLPYQVHDYMFVIASHGYEDPAELERVWNEQRSVGNA